jgi:hypothetical protein
MTKVKPRLTAEEGSLAGIPIDIQAVHFFNPTTDDGI